MKRFACYCFITGVPLLLIIWFLTPIPYFLSYSEVGSSYTCDLEFHGLVCEPNGEPVPGVEVGLEVRTYWLLAGAGSYNRKLITDEKGGFSYSVRNCSSFTITSLRKKGYGVLGRQWWGYRFSKGDPPIAEKENPIIYSMHRTEPR